MKISVLGIDLEKSVFQPYGVGEKHQLVLRKKLSRGKLSRFIAVLPPCLIVMDSCVGAHAWGRQFKKLGHEDISTARRYVSSNPDDFSGRYLGV
jgi:transposase